MTRRTRAGGASGPDTVEPSWRRGSPHSPRAPAAAAEPIRPADERYAAADVQEVPPFRRHLLPLLGRLGCNNRSCHGSFQGQGGFCLSLFGYDYAADHQSLVGGKRPRTDAKNSAESRMFYKPTHADEHGGRERMKVGSWPYYLIRRWIKSGARGLGEGEAELVKVEITPPEIVLSRDGERVALRVVARWSEGSSEDVTPLCRYQTNDESVAEVDADGVGVGKGRGDTHMVAFYDTAVAVARVVPPVSEQFGPRYPDVPAPTKIDALVVANLRKLGIVPSDVCSDGEFLRRVSLDLTGTLPAPQEVEAFLADPAPDKRARKVEELLARPTHVARWTTRLCELMGNSPRQFDGVAPMDAWARQWYEWVARRVRENVPYDELVTVVVLAPATARVAPHVLGGKALDLGPDDDPRRPLVDWLRRKDNPYFARVFVNRVWAEYFGAGIIHPPDDLNLANSPTNAALLDYLAGGASTMAST